MERLINDKYESSKDELSKLQNTETIKSEFSKPNLQQNKEQNDQIQELYLKLDLRQGLGQIVGEDSITLQDPSSLNTPNQEMRLKTLMPCFNKSEIFDIYQQGEISYLQRENILQQNNETQAVQTIQTLNVTEAFNQSNSKRSKEMYNSKSITDHTNNFNQEKYMTRRQLENNQQTTSINKLCQNSLNIKLQRKSQNLKLAFHAQKQYSQEYLDVGISKNLWGYVSPQQIKKNALQNDDKKNYVWKKNWIGICYLISKMRTLAHQSAIFFRPNLLRKFQVRLINDVSSNQQNTVSKLQFANYFLGRQTSYKKFKGLISFRTYVKFMKTTIKYFGCFVKSFLAFKMIFTQMLINIFKYVPLIHNLSTLFLCWESIVFLCCTILFVYLPFEYGFSIERSSIMEKYTQIFTPAILIVDIFVKMNTRSSEQGSLEEQHFEVLKKYIKSSFIIDLVSILCLFDQIFGLQAIYFLFFLKLTQQFRVTEYIREQFLLNCKLFGLISLLYLVTKVVYFAHLFSCLWNGIGMQQANYNSGWLIYYNKLYEPVYSRYLLSFYYSMITMTTIGYGDFNATSNLERLVMIFMTFISCGIFGYTINSIGNVLLDFKKKRDVYLQELAKINQYFHQYDVDLVLQGRARKYLQYLYIDEKKNTSYSIQSLSSLSDYMQNEIKRDVYVKRLQQVNVFNDILTEELKQELALKMNENIYSPDQIIVDSREEKEPQLYFIHSGQVQSFAKKDFNSQLKQIQSYKENQYFGLLNFIIGNRDYDFGYKSIGVSYILQISQSDFISVIKKDNDAFEKYSFLVDQIKHNKQYAIINQSCRSCFQKNHVLKNCPFLFYEGKRDQILRNYFKQINDQVKHFRRRQQSKNNFNARAHQPYIKSQANLLLDQNSDIYEDISFSFNLEKSSHDMCFQPEQFFDTSYNMNDQQEEHQDEKELKNANTGKLSDYETYQNKENADTYKCSILEQENLIQDQKLYTEEQLQFQTSLYKKTKKTSFSENSELHGSQANTSQKQLSSQSEIDQQKTKQVRRSTIDRPYPSQFSLINASQYCLKRQYSNFFKELDQIIKYNFDHQPSLCTKQNCDICLKIIYKLIKQKRFDKNHSSIQNETNKKGSYFQIKQDSRQLSLNCQPVSPSIQIMSQPLSSLENNLNLKNLDMNVKQYQNYTYQNHFMHFDFDRIDTFKYYYPNNNYELVIRGLNQQSDYQTNRNCEKSLFSQL